MPLFTLTSHLVFQFGAAHTQHIFKKDSDCRIKPSAQSLMQVVKLPSLRFTKNMVLSNSLTYLIMKWPKLCASFLNKPFPHILNAYLSRFLSYERCTISKTKQNLYIPKFSTSRYQNSCNYQRSKIWNSITTDLKQKTFKKFKTNYKNLLLQSYH